jgi:hypothetical protein
MTMVRKSDRATIERLSYKVREAAESESAAYRRGRQDARDTILRRFDETEMPTSYYRHIIDRAVPPKVKPAAKERVFNEGRQAARKDIYEMLWAEGFRTNKVFRCLERAVPSDLMHVRDNNKVFRCLERAVPSDLMHVRDNNIHSLGMAPSPDVTPQCDAGVPWCMQNHFGLKSKKPPKCGKLICECSYPQCR